MRLLLQRPRLFALAMALGLVVSACSSDGGADGSAGGSDPSATSSGEAEAATERIVIVASTTIWGDIVSNVAGDNATVEVLLPLGADPHDYQLSAAQAATMQRADLVIVNGLGLEEGLLDAIESLEADGANTVEIAALLDPIEFGVHSPEAEHDEDEHGHGSDDPHVWMDPIRIAEAVELIAAELTALDPSVDWARDAASYADQLRVLDDEVTTVLDGIPADRRKMVTNHDALGYFADRYGFAIIGTVIPGGSTLGDPSSAELADLVDVLTDNQMEVIFAETTVPAALAEAIAAEVDGATVVELFTGSLAGPGSGAETYIDFIRTNATRVAEALR